MEFRGGPAPPERQIRSPYWPDPTSCATCGRDDGIGVSFSFHQAITSPIIRRAPLAHPPTRRVTFSRYSFRSSGLRSVRGRSGTVPRTTGS